MIGNQLTKPYINDLANPLHLDRFAEYLKDWTIVKQRRLGQIEWDSAKVRLMIDERQKIGEGLEGTELRSKFEVLPLLNANCMAYLLDHPYLVPKNWYDKYVCFWGTIFRDCLGELCVLYMFWDIDLWLFSQIKIEKERFGKECVAAFLMTP